MSYTTLYRITPKGRLIEQAEFKNSHRGATMCWGELWRLYCKDRIEQNKKENGWEPHFPVTDDDYKLVWALFRNQDIPEYVRAVLGSSFDYVVLEKDHFERFYEDVLKYAGDFPAGSMIEQAREIMKLKNRKIRGVCWQQTSVSDDMWRGMKITEDMGAWSLYAAIEHHKSNANREPSGA
jgi:hypothetical protein